MGRTQPNPDEPLRATWKKYYDDVIAPYRKFLKEYQKSLGK